LARFLQAPGLLTRSFVEFPQALPPEPVLIFALLLEILALLKLSSPLLNQSLNPSNTSFSPMVQVDKIGIRILDTLLPEVLGALLDINLFA
jgi:hypothetical protein